MKIVVLERNSVGTDISVDGLKQFGEVVCYPNLLYRKCGSEPGMRILSWAIKLLFRKRA